VLYTFPQDELNGADPTSLIFGRDGKFYGTTESGGYGYGMVFAGNQDGRVAPLYYFGPTPPFLSPQPASLLQGRDGCLYGTTSEGGAQSGGTIFRIGAGREGNEETVLYNFSRAPAYGGGFIGPVCIRLPYPTPGSLIGEITFEASAGASDCDGKLTWRKPAQSSPGRYPAGFATILSSVGSRYSAPTNGQLALNLSTTSPNANVQFTEPGLHKPLIRQITVTSGPRGTDTVTVNDSRPG
jgi:uncharacterized repeat protein (TIGR03803 family)